ncbi:uncharacterized protein METZ01_LOCUS217117 [marine metagenome]|uniref:Uncharacterized protein n=1 Tax=marine metagenome TaxID=408172 RepID=A0A382FPW1_9ZZZZ
MRRLQKPEGGSKPRKREQSPQQIQNDRATEVIVDRPEQPCNAT